MRQPALEGGVSTAGPAPGSETRAWEAAGEGAGSEEERGCAQKACPSLLGTSPGPPPRNLFCVQMDTSGVAHRFFATAMGKGKNGAKSQLEKLNLETMTCKEAVMEVDCARPIPSCRRAPCALASPTHPHRAAPACARQVAKILYAQHDPAKDKPMELELSWICDATDKMHMLVPPEMRAEAETAAKAARDAMDDD